MKENKGAKPQESPPETIEGAIASSPEAISEAQEKVSETPTPEQGETQPVKEEQGETPLHENPRFKEVVDEKNWYKERLQEMVNRPAPQPQQPQTQQDPYAGMDAETARFYQQMDARIDQRAGKLLQTKITPQIDAARNEFARIKTAQFHAAHPEIKPNSPEERAIAQKISEAAAYGYPLDPESAYRDVMYPNAVGQKRETNEQQQQQKLQAKKQANVVSPSSVSQAAVPPHKETYDEEIARRMRTEDITE